MGGRGSGGARAGSGRKPKDGATAFLHGKRGAIAPKVVPSVANVDLPAGMTVEQAAVWIELAPHAIQAGTLTPGTAASFRRLCCAVVKLARWEAQIERDGDTYLKVTVDGSGQEHTELKAHPLIAKAQGLDKDIRAWSKDYAINPFGKPMASGKPEPVDPFAEFDDSTVQ